MTKFAEEDGTVIGDNYDTKDKATLTKTKESEISLLATDYQTAMPKIFG